MNQVIDETGLSVVQVVSGRMHGGGQRVMLDIEHSLSGEAGLSMTPLLLGPSDPRMRALGFRSVPYDGRYDHPRLLLTARALRHALDELRWPHVLHSHGWDADFACALARLGRPGRHLVHLHVTASWLSGGGWRQRLRRVLTRWAFSRPGVELLAVSEAVREHWARYLPWERSKIHVVHNGVDTCRFQPAGKDRPVSVQPVIGVAARLAPMKGLEVLLQALARLRSTDTVFECRIAGDGGLRQQLQRQADRLGLSECVRFLGHVDDMPAFYRELDLFVLPSVSDEGLPLSVLEAMASGLPVLASDVGGTREALLDRVHGRLLPAGDVPALAAELSTFLSDANLRRACGRAARARAERDFSLQGFSERLMQIYSHSAS